jgi:hypothetical protein
VHDRLKSIGKTLAPAFAGMLFLLNAPCQTTTSGPASPFASASPFSADHAASFVAAPTFDVSALPELLPMTRRGLPPRKTRSSMAAFSRAPYIEPFKTKKEFIWRRSSRPISSGTPS